MSKNPLHQKHDAEPAEAGSKSASRPRMEARLAAGKALRTDCPRKAHAALDPHRLKRDPVAVLQAADVGRMPELLPIKYARMAVSPFAFYRGAAPLMAYDLAGSPQAGINVQLCGDAHLVNFGGFASPERSLLFGINDFDETLPGPFEWDVKRLAASFVLAARSRSFSESHTERIVATLMASYRENLQRLAGQTMLDVWYQRITFEDLVTLARSRAGREQNESLMEQARHQSSGSMLNKMTHSVQGVRRITDTPPLIFHPAQDEAAFRKDFDAYFAAYRASLPDERRTLLDRYTLIDVAYKVVGVGSVGTRCLVALLQADDDDALFLQFKEANASCLEAYLAPSPYGNHGERVVQGQRRVQSVSDIFLGWARSPDGQHDFYVRQLRDMKVSVDPETLDASELEDYAQACAMALSRSHAKGGDAATLAGYLGNKAEFDEAIWLFAQAYADQNEKDHAALLAAIKQGRVKVADASALR